MVFTPSEKANSAPARNNLVAVEMFFAFAKQSALLRSSPYFGFV
jgi:hypothetical protein